MHTKIKILSVLSLVLGLMIHFQAVAQVPDYIPGKMSIAGSRPDRIILHPGDKGETSNAVNRRTESPITVSFLELAPEAPDPEFQMNLKHFSASTSNFTTEKEDEPILSFNNHAVKVDQMTPGARMVQTDQVSFWVDYRSTVNGK